MRDPTVQIPEDAIAAAVHLFKVRRSWLRPTTIDWSDIDQRMQARLHLARLPEALMPTHSRELLYRLLDELEPLPRDRGRYQKGQNVPRDSAIRAAVDHVRKRFGYPIVGSEQAIEQITAAAVVSVALKRVGITLSRQTVADIWKDRV